MHEEHQVPIWYFIGWMLAIYGAIICGYGILSWNHAPPATMPKEIYKLHADVWWGGLMIILGTVYILKFPPSKGPTRPVSDKDEEGKQ